MANRIYLFISVSIAFLGGLSSAYAAASCSWRTVVGVNFGTYDVFTATPNDSTGTLTYRCTGSAGAVSIDLSRGSAPSFSPRYMLNGAQQLNYNLYLDSAHTSIWGDGTSGTVHYTINNPANGQNVSVTVYGRAPASQDIGTGAYADTIVATINF